MRSHRGFLDGFLTALSIAATIGVIVAAWTHSAKSMAGLLIIAAVSTAALTVALMPVYERKERTEDPGAWFLSGFLVAVSIGAVIAAFVAAWAHSKDGLFISLVFAVGLGLPAIFAPKRSE